MLGEMPFELRETILNPEELRESADNEKEAQEKAGQLREILAASTDDYLERGVNPNTPSTAVGYTPLMQAASSANLELVKLLIDAGADLNSEDQQGRTALNEAEMYTHSSAEHRTVVAFLKERGARNGNEKK